MEKHASKKTNKPPKSVNHKVNIKFSNPLPLVRSISNKERGEPPKRTPNLEEPSPIAITCLKIKIAFTCYNAINTLYL
jgi:hypothetical protein